MEDFIHKKGDIMYLDLSKSFDAVPKNTLLSILERCRFDRWIVDQKLVAGLYLEWWSMARSLDGDK